VTGQQQSTPQRSNAVKRCDGAARAAHYVAARRARPHLQSNYQQYIRYLFYIYLLFSDAVYFTL
jgi:hypothetical protein